MNIYADLQTRGIFRFYDGTIIYVEEVQYSADGKTYWENTFNPETHISTIDNVTVVPGHKYRRVRHAGDTYFQIPSLWVPEDGQSVMMRVDGDTLQYKLELAEEWTDLYDLSTLEGPQGPQGEMGQGWYIDNAGALDTRGSCCSTTTSTSSCTSCNRNVSTSNQLSTYMSLGNHKITINDIGDGATYWHSLDGVAWVQTTSDNEGDFVCAWQATDGAGTAALTMNNQGYEVALASLVSPYISKGKVYICADGIWTELMNVTTPTGLVKVESNDSLGYLEDKVDGTTIEAYDSNSDVILDKIRVKDDGINENKITSTAIGDGLDGGSGTVLTADPTDFIGFGLREYVSDSDSLNDVQVFVDDFIGDGLISYDDSANQADGEDRNLARVNVDDIISPTTGVFTGLETSTDAGITETDGFDNIYVKPGDCIEVDIDGVNVKADELSIVASGLTELAVKTYVAGNDGILASHLNPNVANENKGLLVNNSTGIEVKVDNSTIGFDGTGQLEVIDNGITGDKLNDNVADNTKGIEVLNDMLAVKVDGTTIDFNGSGELEVVRAVVDSDLDDLAVKSITVNDNGTPGNTVDNNVVFQVNEGATGAINTSITANGTTENITMSIDIDPAWFDARYEPLGGGGVTINWGEIAGTVTDQVDLVAYIEGLGHVVKNTWYGNTQISDGNGTYSDSGIILKSSGGEVFKLSVDDAGNIITTQAT